MTRIPRRNRGFSLVELLIAMVVTLIIMAAGLMMFKKSSDAIFIVSQKAEMQSNARVAINSIVRDLSRAGSGGMTHGGISLPTTTAVFAPPYAGPPFNGIVNVSGNVFSDGVLYMVTPDWKGGPTINGQTTDGIAVSYVDPILEGPENLPNVADLRLHPTTNISANGDMVTLDPVTTTALNDPGTGVKVGDVFMLVNSKGTVAASVSGFVAGGTAIGFAQGDPLKMNDTSGGKPGSISSLGNPCAVGPGCATGVNYPPVTLFRIMLVSYFIEQLDGLGNPLTVTAAGAQDYRLMRQVNAQAPVTMAEHVVALNFSYDLRDANPGGTNSPDAKIMVSGVDTKVYPEIRNVYVSVTTRSSTLDQRGNYFYATMFTNESPRNLSFFNQFPQSSGP
jgi:prepilin-type N-terminal cleavage/methylation domain-containing protein